MKNYNVDHVKRRAKAIKREKGVPYHEALDQAAQEVDFQNWQHFLRDGTSFVLMGGTGTLIRIEPDNWLAISIGPISQSVRCYTHHGDLICMRQEISICRDQSKAALFRPMRIVQPYGKWTCNDGTEVLFNRDYRPLWKKYSDGKVAAADPDEWVKYSNQEYFYGDHNIPSENTDTCRICTSQLRDWGVEHQVPAMLKLFREAVKSGDPSIMRRRSIYDH